MTNTMYAFIERCFDRDYSVHECYASLAEEYTMRQIPNLTEIRKIYHECKEVYDRF